MFIKTKWNENVCLNKSQTNPEKKEEQTKDHTE